MGHRREEMAGQGQDEKERDERDGYFCKMVQISINNGKNRSNKEKGFSRMKI